MLPTGHIEFTWATLSILQQKARVFPNADYRLVALAALAPDLLDKPLALTVYQEASAALFWGHNLWFHLAVWGVVGLACWLAGRRDRVPGAQFRPRFAASLPYLLAFSGHLIADRMWGFQETLFYPLGAGYWHPWVHVGQAGAMLEAYLEIVRTTPILVVFEVIGLGLLAWFIADRGLWQRERLGAFLRTGRLSPGAEAGACRVCASRWRALASLLAEWLMR